MKRVHLFEIGDQSWCPIVFRNLLTDFLQVFAKTFRVYGEVGPFIEKGLLRINSRHIVDLCSGSSGPWHLLAGQANDISIVLTDKYPNLGAFEKISAESCGRISFVADSTDATNVPRHLPGMRTIFSGFHHFRPEVAKSILQDAALKRTAIGIFEFTERRLQTLLLAPILIPMSVFILTIFIRPFRASRLFWTYCIPIAPLLIMWDGVISHLRTYSTLELEDLVGAIESSKYNWEIGKYQSALRGVQITYLLGFPTD
jgi:hypothetical protein